MSALVAPSDYLARLDGSNFVYLISGSDQENVVHNYVRQIKAVFDSPFNIDDVDIYVDYATQIKQVPDEVKTWDDFAK